MRYLLRLYKYFKPYNGQLALGALSVVLGGAFGMGSPLLINFAVRFGLNPQTENGHIVGIHGNALLLILA